MQRRAKKRTCIMLLMVSRLSLIESDSTLISVILDGETRSILPQPSAKTSTIARVRIDPEDGRCVAVLVHREPTNSRSMLSTVVY